MKAGHRYVCAINTERSIMKGFHSMISIVAFCKDLRVNKTFSIIQLYHRLRLGKLTNPVMMTDRFIKITNVLIENLIITKNRINTTLKINHTLTLMSNKLIPQHHHIKKGQNSTNITNITKETEQIMVKIETHIIAPIKYPSNNTPSKTPNIDLVTVKRNSLLPEHLIAIKYAIKTCIVQKIQTSLTVFFPHQPINMTIKVSVLILG